MSSEFQTGRFLGALAVPRREKETCYVQLKEEKGKGYKFEKTDCYDAEKLLGVNTEPTPE